MCKLLSAKPLKQKLNFGLHQLILEIPLADLINSSCWMQYRIL